MAGDLVIQESPKVKPNNIDKSNRGNLAKSKANMIDNILSVDKRLSGTASRSKKKAKGRKI